MAKRLPIPADLQHLMEKRESADRRAKPRRAKDKAVTKPSTVATKVDDATATSTRRKKTDRRTTGRRKSDKS